MNKRKNSQSPQLTHNKSVLLLVLSSRLLFGMEVNCDPIPEKYKATNVPLEETRFGQWLTKNGKLLDGKKIKKTCSSRTNAITFDNPNKLTTAGFIFICSIFPLEIQREIIRHIIPTLSATTLGIHEDDLTYRRDGRHATSPHLVHNQYNNTIQCDRAGGCQIKKEITLTDGYFKNRRVPEAPSKIRLLWQMVQNISKKNNLGTPELFIFEPREQTMFSGHNVGYTTAHPHHGGAMYNWHFKSPTQNQMIFSNPTALRNNLTPTEMLALIDAEHRLQGKVNKEQLSKQSLEIVTNVKRKIADDTQYSNTDLSMEPIIIQEKRVPKPYNKRKRFHD